MLSRFIHVLFFMTLWTVTCQAPLSMGFSRQAYWTGLSCLSSGDLLDPGIEPISLTSPALAGQFFTTSMTWEALSSSGRAQNTLLMFIRFCEIKFNILKYKLNFRGIKLIKIVSWIQNFKNLSLKFHRCIISVVIIREICSDSALFI